MTIAEMAYRAERQLRLWRDGRIAKRLSGQSPPEPEIAAVENWMAFPKTIGNHGACLEAADEILAGRLVVFQRDADAYSVIRHWNTDPKSGVPAPMVFGKSLDYRDAALVGDIKYLWEPARHLHLVTLAQAHRLTGSDVYLKGIHLFLRSWMEQCPYLMGPHWSSSLEVAIRLINWSIVWQLIGGNASALFEIAHGRRLRAQWLASIYQHMAFIFGNFSRYSSANNHLIGEAAGLFIACNTWPFWEQTSAQWRSVGRTVLIQEAVKQCHPDGVNREQAIAYQQFVLDFLILSLLSGQSAGVAFPESYRKRIEKMLEFIAALMDTGGNLPMLGDADDGYVVRLSQEPDFCPYRSLLATGAVLFRRPDFLQRAGRLDDKTRWLLGDDADTAATPPGGAAWGGKSFPQGGYYTLGSDFGTSEEIRCLIDCGPLGYLSIAAHGHADALSLYLSVGGKEFLIDPGTYCYHMQKKWRDYFRGTSAHNTVRVDRVDQSVSGGNFMWIHKARAQAVGFESTPDFDTFEGRHDGYGRLDDPVMHRRRVVFNKRQKTIHVTDWIQCTGPHHVERFWHFHEHCRVQLNGNALHAEHNGLTISLSCGEKAQTCLHIGNNEPPLGWVSRRYDLKVPGYTAVMSNTIAGTTKLQTEIEIQKVRT